MSTQQVQLPTFTSHDIESIQAPCFKSPELILLTTLTLGLKLIRSDYDDHKIVKTNSWLYRLFNSVALQRYDFFDQAVEVFCTQPDNPRHLKVDLTYNAKADKIPTIFLSLAQDSMAENNLGVEHGQNGYFADDDQLAINYVFTKTRRFESTVSVYIYSDNSNETILIYSVLKALLITLSDHLALLGLLNLSYSGQDIAQYPDFVPKGFFYRVLTIRCNYSTSTPDLDFALFIKEFCSKEPQSSNASLVVGLGFG